MWYYIREFILYIWQFPQNLLALLLLLFYKREKLYHKLNGRKFYFTTEMPSGISLGNYIIMNRQDKEDGMKHEYGHSIDSRRLGPIYLIVVGIPSLLGNIYSRIFKKSNEWYYNLPWEKSADINGGVVRIF